MWVFIESLDGKVSYLFSYSERADNSCHEIALYCTSNKNKTQLYIAVSGHVIDTKFNLRKNRYYHICVVWRSIDGIISTFVNGKRKNHSSPVNQG